MIFLGLEKPVEYQSQSVFNPATAQMVLNANRDYINALYQDYRQAIADMKEFNKEYGEFLSPVYSDMEWYDKNVTGRLKNFINNLYSQGIDPLRSVEGRSAVARELAKMPIQQIAEKRRSAKSAEEYIKNRDALKAAGMWDEDYERSMLGGQLLEEWDGSLGPWKATSASPYMDYEKKYGHLFDKMDYEYDPEESKKHPGMMVMTKNKSRMHDILSASRPDLVNDSQYKYDLARIKAANPEFTDEQATSALENEIVNRNYKGGMHMQEDPYAMARFKANLVMQQLKEKTRQQEQKPVEPGPRTFMERVRDNIIARQEQKPILNSFGEIANYWNEMAKKEEASNSPVLSRELIPGTQQSIPFGTFGTSSTYNTFGQYMPKLGFPSGGEYNYTYDNSKNNNYKYYISERDRWTKMAQTGDYIVSDRDKSKTAEKIRKIQSKPYDKRTQEELQFVSDYAQSEYTKMMSKVNSNAPAHLGKKGQTPGTTTYKDLMQRSHAWWQNNEATGLSNNAKQVFSNYFYGINDKSKDLGELNTAKRVSLSDGSYHYAPITQSMYAGPGRFKYNSIFSKFDRWITNRQHLFRAGDVNNVRFAELPNARGGRDATILAYPQATRDQIMEFYEKHGGRYNNVGEMVKDLGLIPHDETLSTKDLDSGKYNQTTYFSIPVMKTGSNFGGQLYRDFNTESNKLDYGEGSAFKMAVDDENQSLMDWEEQQILNALMNQ